MGLDWIPMGKPKPGSEERFNQLYRLIQGIDKPSLSFLDKLMGKKSPTKEVLLAEWFTIQIPSYETIGAPRVNRDGQQLMNIADRIALENNLQRVKDQRMPLEDDEDSLESKLHILYAASKWLIYYGGKGHGYEVDF